MKDFDRWNKKKKQIEDNPNNYLQIRERQIWWAALGINVGDEEDGKHDFFERPVLIIKKFNNRIAWVVPLSTKPGHPKYYKQIQHGDRCSFVMLSQLRLLSLKRLTNYMSRLSTLQFLQIKENLIQLLK